MVSSIAGNGIEEMWKTMQKYVHKMKVNAYQNPHIDMKTSALPPPSKISTQEVGDFDTKRMTQRRQWLWSHIDWQLRYR